MTSRWGQFENREHGMLLNAFNVFFVKKNKEKEEKHIYVSF